MSAKLNWKNFKGEMKRETRNWPEQAKNELIKEFVALQSLISQIHSEIEPEIEAIRRADAYATGGYRTQLENLGMVEPGSRERDFGCGFKFHNPSGSVDQELSETEKALVYCASRNESPDKPI